MNTMNWYQHISTGHHPRVIFSSTLSHTSGIHINYFRYSFRLLIWIGKLDTKCCLRRCLPIWTHWITIFGSRSGESKITVCLDWKAWWTRRVVCGWRGSHCIHAIDATSLSHFTFSESMGAEVLVIKAGCQGFNFSPYWSWGVQLY